MGYAQISNSKNICIRQVVYISVVEAADEKANQAADASTQDGGGGHGGGTHGNERGTNFLSCTRGCCAWGGGARTFCVKCCSNPEEAHDNTKNESHA